MTDSDRFAIVPIYSDSTGNSAIPQNAIFHGTRSAVMERILDSRARNQCLTLINDAEHAKGTLQSIRQRERDVAAREDAVSAREDSVAKRDLADAIAKLDALAARMSPLELDERLQSEDAVLTSPPGVAPLGEADPPITDEGDLQTPKPPDPDFERLE